MWCDKGTMSLDAFIELNEGFTPQEIQVIHSHLINVGEYIDGGGAMPFYKLERV